MTTRTNTTTVTFTKLHSGEWGLKGSAAILTDGHDVAVSKRDGSTSTATVGRVVWTDGTTAITTIAGTRSSRPAGRRYTGYTNYREDNCPTGGDCWSFPSIKYCHSCGKGE